MPNPPDARAADIRGDDIRADDIRADDIPADDVPADDVGTNDIRDAQPMFVATALLLCAYAAGFPLASPMATVAACAAILLFGLPHGTLDLELVKTQHRAGPRRMAGVLLLYVGLAGAMYLFWQAAPVGALAVFLIVAVVHFAEDWEDAGSAFFAQGLAVATLTAPTFLHLAEIRSLFVDLSGDGRAASLGDAMLLLAPVSLAVAGIASLSHWRAGRRGRAATGIAVIAAMALLPPAVGFAAFFCLHHSPRHFRAACAGLSADQFRRRWRFVAPLTLAALGLAAWLFGDEARGDLSAQAVAACFMTLSILTVPHMAVPAILARAGRRLADPVFKEPPHADQGPPRIQAQG